MYYVLPILLGPFFIRFVINCLLLPVDVHASACKINRLYTGTLLSLLVSTTIRMAFLNELEFGVWNCEVVEP